MCSPSVPISLPSKLSLAKKVTSSFKEIPNSARLFFFLPHEASSEIKTMDKSVLAKVKVEYFNALLVRFAGCN